MAHALSSPWSFGKSKLDLKKSSLRRVRSSHLKLASWRGELVVNSEPHTGTQPSVCLCVWPELARCVHKAHAKFGASNRAPRFAPRVRKKHTTLQTTTVLHADRIFEIPVTEIPDQIFRRPRRSGTSKWTSDPGGVEISKWLQIQAESGPTNGL
jgi:hypothetical protein